MSFNRILVLGIPGSGKTTITKLISDTLNLPSYHLDCYFRVKKNHDIDQEFMKEKTNEIIKNEKWVIDGNYYKTMSLRLSKADFVILLNLPTNTCVKRAIDRFNFTKGKQREDAPIGLIDNELDKSFIHYIRTFKLLRLGKILRLIKSFKVPYVKINNQKELDNLKEEIKTWTL